MFVQYSSDCITRIFLNFWGSVFTCIAQNLHPVGGGLPAKLPCHGIHQFADVGHSAAIGPEALFLGPFGVPKSLRGGLEKGVVPHYEGIHVRGI